MPKNWMLTQKKLSTLKKGDVFFWNEEENQFKYLVTENHGDIGGLINLSVKFVGVGSLCGINTIFIHEDVEVPVITDEERTSDES